MKTEKNGLELIKQFEGLELSPYLCPANVPTIGYGATYYKTTDKKVKLSDPKITKKYAEELLKGMLTTYEDGVRRYVQKKINQNQFDALVSFAYNLGLGALKSSTLLKKINVNPNDPDIKNQFKRWVKSGGKTLQGLVKRRTKEAELYFTGLKIKAAPMQLTVKRFADDGDTTLGVLYINGVFECFTVEDEERAIKKSGETRVPNGTYDVAFRKEGSFHTKYSGKYPSIHQGMLCISNAPDWKLENNGLSFQYILIHTGNTDEHTKGCLLVNDSVSGANFTGSSSVDAYKDFYPKVAAILEAGAKVSITYIDIEDGKNTSESIS